MTRLPILLAGTILEERRRERATLRRQSVARESLAERKRVQKLAKARARDAKRSLRREPAEIDVVIDLTDRATSSESKEYARN